MVILLPGIGRCGPPSWRASALGSGLGGRLLQTARRNRAPRQAASLPNGIASFRRAKCAPGRVAGRLRYPLPTNCVLVRLDCVCHAAGTPTNRSSDGVETQSIPRRQSDERRGSDAPSLTLATAVAVALAIFVAAFLLGLCFRCMRRRQLPRTSMAAGDTTVGNGPIKG